MIHDQPSVPVNLADQQQVAALAGYQYGAGYGHYHEPVEEGWSFDPLKVFWFVIHYRWLIAAFLLAGIISGTAFTYSQTPMYRASAKIAIQTAGARVIQDLDVVSNGSNWRDYETAREIMLSRDLARRVVFTLDLADKQEFLTSPPRLSLANLIKRVFGKSINQPVLELTPEESEKRAIGIAGANVSARLIKDTSVLVVDFTHSSPFYAAEVANQFVKSFIDQNIDYKSQTSDLARQFIEEQVSETKEKLQLSEKALVKYAQKAGITITGDDVSLISSNIADINRALAKAIHDRLSIERYDQQVKDGDSASLPEVFSSKSIQANKQKIAELKAIYQQKLSTLKPSFPEMRRLNAQIKELVKQMNLEVAAIAKSVKIRYIQTKEKEKALQRELVDLDQKQSAFQEKNIQYTILKREVNSNRKQYESLIGKLNSVGIGSEIKSFNALVIDSAVQPGFPFSPRRFTNLIAALILFGVLAAVAIYALELMNNTFAVPDQLERELKIPILGIIPEVPEDDIATEFENPISPLSEAHRTLRTSIQFTGTDDNINTLLVTSSEKSEGKTVTAFRLAADFAALGRKVLVIDADLRKPRMHRMFGTNNRFGLSNLLTNVRHSEGLFDLFRSTDNPNITFLSSGTIPPNPTDILSSKKMRLTLHFCSKKFDLVIIDSPPVMGLSDAPILAQQVDATLFVVSSKQVTRNAAKSCLSRLRLAGTNVVGCAFTKFAVNKLDYNYAFRYMNYNYYAYEDEENARARLESHGANDNTHIKNSTTSAFLAFIDRVTRRTG